MIIGEKERFAIEAQQESDTDGHWRFGRFRFWVYGIPVGNWDDSTTLDSCAGWLRRFSKEPIDRFEPLLDDATAERVFELTYDAAMRSWPPETPVADPLARFHISHLGMSSFEFFDMLLIRRADGRERLLWRDARIGELHDVDYEPGELERVAAQFCDHVDGLADEQWI